ncbi:DUF5623 domain-containing protein [Pedobacter sp. MC2016-24]|uniref:DUF5623 domain-containing protein n=1 Tax=Pedobacter sp. MC2016-24 TaxID=2780090 RepID=UPI00187FB14B|nr:DUF5623 domain-containing protein [Pedobacter sp. MC2016-24]MBE9601474.1 DUF5623 domain-containing protein [Pedobacter sp. MC2016-24]
MNQHSTGITASTLKTQAKKLKKDLGIPHHIALNQVAVQAGYQSWKDYLTNTPQNVRSKSVNTRPSAPKIPVLKSQDLFTGAVIGERPNASMPVADHTEIGALLQHILSVTAYHKRANRPVNDIILKLDEWLGYEYNEQELPNQQFNKIYMGGRFVVTSPVPSGREQEKLKRQLRKVKSIIERCYHHCSPINKLLARFDLALKALCNWPTSIKIPLYKQKKTKLVPGTFVRMKGSKKLMMVFSHSLQSKIVEGYGDGGTFSAGRHEVTLVKDPIDLSHFKPLRLYLPYGMWDCEDGSQVLFNREFCPLWIRSKTGVVSSADPSKTIEHTNSTIYFGDRTAPYYLGNKKQLENCVAILKDWKVEHKRPRILDLIPAAIAAGDISILDPQRS